MDRKEVERLMGVGDGEGGIFTWREKNGRKVSDTSPLNLAPAPHLTTALPPRLVGILCVSACAGLRPLGTKLTVRHACPVSATTDAAQTRTVRLSVLVVSSCHSPLNWQCHRKSFVAMAIPTRVTGGVLVSSCSNVSTGALMPIVER